VCALCPSHYDDYCSMVVRYGCYSDVLCVWIMRSLILEEMLFCKVVNQFIVCWEIVQVV